MGCTNSKSALPAEDLRPNDAPIKKTVRQVANPLETVTEPAVIDSSSHSATTPAISQLPSSPPSPPHQQILHENPRALMAAQKIQRLSRRKKSCRSEQDVFDWKIFAQLDTRDEAEMLHLAIFMQTLLDHVPNAQNPEMESSRKLQLHHGPTGTVTVLDGLGPTSPRASLNFDNSIILLNDIQIEDTTSASPSRKSESNAEYESLKGTITPSVAAKVVETLRKPDGRVSQKMAHKIMRQVYRMMKEKRPVTYMEMDLGCQITVVGDLHGQLYDLIHILDECGLPSASNKYIFNGDFVDRGSHSVEIMLVLFVLIAAHPDDVILNRGNHGR